LKKGKKILDFGLPVSDFLKSRYHLICRLPTGGRFRVTVKVSFPVRLSNHLSLFLRPFGWPQPVGILFKINSYDE